MSQRISAPVIRELQEGEIFVFGSNLAGIHGAGAAALAKKWGAKNKVGEGLSGKTYAIPTKDAKIRTLSVRAISHYVNTFIDFAKDNPSLIFLVTEIGCGLAGYEPEDIAPLFLDAIDLQNVYLPKRFIDIIAK